MLNINASKTTVTITEGNKVTSFPVGTFVVYKENQDKITLMSTVSSFRYSDELHNITPKFTKNFKNIKPTLEDNENGKDGDIWYDNKTKTFYKHNGTEFTLVSKPFVIDKFIHTLSCYLNGEENL